MKRTWWNPTALGHGLLFMLLDPETKLCVTFVSRMPSQREYAANAYTFARRRHPGEVVA